MATAFARTSAPHPVSHAQARFLVADARCRGAGPLQRALCLLPRGVDQARVRQAVALISGTQEALRTRFSVDAAGTSFTQHLAEHGGPHVAVHEIDGNGRCLLRDLVDGDLIARLHPAIDPFGAAPLARIHLVRAADGASALAWTVHHAIFDGASGAALYGQLTALLQAACPRAVWPALAQRIAPYRDFVDHERAVLSGASLRALQSFWRDYLAGAAPAPCTAGAADAADPLEVHALDLAFPAVQVVALRARARAHRLTPHLFLLGCMQWAVGACTGEHDILTTTPTRNRPARFAETIGCFVNPALVRQHVRMEASMADHLERLRTSARAAYRHGALPMSLLAAARRPGGPPAAHAFFAVRVETATEAAQARSGFRLVPLPPDRAMAAPWALELWAAGGRLAGRFQSRRRRDPHHGAARLFGHLVDAALRDPARPLGEAVRSFAGP